MTSPDSELVASLGGVPGTGTEPSDASRANSAGVRYPMLLCGLSSLNSFCHAAIFRRASHKFSNQLVFRHSSRSLP